MDSGENSSVALKAGVWYVVSTVLVRAMSIITTPIFTRLLSTEEYGMVSTFTTWYNLLLPIFSLNLSYSIGRAKIDFPDKLDDYIGSMQLLSALVSAALVAVVVAFIKPVSQFLSLSDQVIFLLLAYLFFMPAINFAQNGYRYRYQYRQNIAISWYTALTNAGISLALILLIEADKVLLRCIGIVVPMVALSLFFWGRAIKGKHLKVNREYWKYGLVISLPMIVHTVSMHILSTSDRIFITNICGASDTGIYSLAYQFGAILSLLTNAINDGWLPWFHDNYHAGNYDLINKNTKLLVILGCYVGLACIGFAPEGVALLGGKSYAAAIYCVPPIVMGVVCQFIYTHYVNIELHLKKTVFVSIGTVFAAVLNLILNAIFIPRYGYVTAAYTTLISYLALFLAHYIITKAVLHVKLYNDWFMFAAMLVVGVVGVILTLTYEHIVMRYLLIMVGFVSFLFVFRNFIGTYINKFLGKIRQ